MSSNPPTPLTRKRGRPKGAKTKPKPASVAEFIQVALANPIQPPPVAPKVTDPKRSKGIWAGLKTPEERSEYGRYLASLRNPRNMARTKRRTGTPHGWTGEAAKVAKARAELEAAEFVQSLQRQVPVLKQDAELARATQEALALIRSPGGLKSKQRAAAQLLAFYHPEVERTFNG